MARREARGRPLEMRREQEAVGRIELCLHVGHWTEGLLQ